ncbi:hypothetical protein S40293_10059 [Stachybotrys chartarum IBT 40293]|nr:hypothetical protein S40293_10059 [Stachybotrys chartarum IBT 40293]
MMETTSEAAAATVPPEDLIPITTDHCQQEQPYDNTVRPILDPTTRTGTRFEAFHVPKRDLVVRPLPSTPLKLFQRFLPKQTVQQWVDYTNNPANHSEDHQGQWKPTSVSEIYIWVAVLIYMSLHAEKRYQDYWRAPAMMTIDETVYQNVPVHLIIQYMTYERFYDIKRRIRIDDPDTIAHGVPRPYSQVSEWSDSLKAVSLAAVEVGSHIAVDEAICGFQGRSKQKVTIKNKPTPTGLKIWILATQGYILHWIWHTPGSALGPVGHCRRKKDKDDPYDINPTQAVVLLGGSDMNMVHFLSKEFETVGRDSSAPRAVAQTWILSFQQIEKQHILASDLLSLMSLLDRQDIPALFLSQYIQQKESDKGSVDDIKLTEALGVLKAFSFITEDNSGSYDMHRLVQLVTREFASKDEAQAKASLLHCMAAYFNFEGQWGDAEGLNLEAVRIRRENFGENDTSTLASMANLASTFWNQGRWKDAEELEVQVMETRKTKLGADHPDTLTSMANLASTFWNQGRWKDAEELEVQVMETRKMKLGADHPDTLTSMANLAFTYRSQVRYTEAVSLMSRCIKEQAVKLGVAHPAYRDNAAALARWESELSVSDAGVSS